MIAIADAASTIFSLRSRDDGHALSDGYISALAFTSILSTGPCTAPNILWLETALWCAAPMDIRFALKSRSRCKFGREIERQKDVSLAKHGANI